LTFSVTSGRKVAVTLLLWLAAAVPTTMQLVRARAAAM